MKLQVKAFKHSQMKDFFFKPFSPQEEISITDLKEIFDSNGLSETDSYNLARFLIEPVASAQGLVEFNPERCAT